MKLVLILIESRQLREYISLKLEENSVEVRTANNPVEGIAKMRTLVPDLIILDYHIDHKSLMELLKEKKADVNTVNTPVVILAQKLEQKQLLELTPYNVKKVINKPIKIDALYASFSETLGIHIDIDESAGIVEVHVNENIVFIEIAKGLNRDKINLLHFKISELVDLYKIQSPRIIVMMSDIKLDQADTPNMLKLLDTVLQASGAKPDNIRFLTRDDFVCQIINGSKEYSGIKAVSDLQLAIDDLVPEEELAGDTILQARNNEEDEENLALKFEIEEKRISFDLIKDSVKNLRIAVIDDDFIIQALIKKTFENTGALIYTFSDGGEFLEVVDTADYDLAFLDINMPKVNGFEVLKALQARIITYPVIVLSAISQRETMIKAIKMGVKSYLVKPLKPKDIFIKSVEILKANF